MSTSVKVLAMYRSLMKEARTLPAYNFRMYALRRIRDAFKDNKSIGDQGEINKQLELAEESLNLIKRQAQIGQLYSTDKLIIEK
ncbi:LYR motif-containing protein bcn92 [Arctopsyche grandis]|uniref:LYR motif-containing protein bcn92 n=1 Tax=Arctopsyche grandis TaxID=121162 RepID=UPI00406D6C01